MSARRNYTRQHLRRITVQGIRRETPDLHKLSRALIALAEAQAEKEAEAERASRDQSTEEELGDV